ncbi:MAG: GNAT family N-acetyltransferase [Moraxellaceae bacterium]|nr:GNAT family N-acetyltransferase [Moraxellaceae bacterium]
MKINASDADVRIAVATPEALADAQRFYDDCGYGGAAIVPEDTVVIARHARGIIAIVRLCHEGGLLCLRGMQVHPEYRRQGIGTQLLRTLERAIGERSCYCLPYSHLVEFYAQAGFAVLAADELPELLQERLAHNRRRGLDVIAMRR